MNLYGLTNDYIQVKTLMDSMYTDNPEADTETYEMTLESIKSLVTEQAAGLAKYLKELEAIEQFQKEEAKALQELAKKTAKRKEKLLENIAEAMTAMELKEVQAGAYKFKFKKGSEVTEVNEHELPPMYFTEEIVRKPLPKADLKKAVKESGITIPGVQVIRNPDKLELK